MILLIDGDFLPWVVSYNCREASYDYEIEQMVDSIISGLIEKSGATEVVGYLGLPGLQSFRAGIATQRPYKGKRGEKPDYFEQWAGVVCQYLRNKYNFQVAEAVSWEAFAYETDDMITSYAAALRSQNIPHVICSTDKDLKQIPGTHLNPTKMEFLEVSFEMAQRSLWKQALTGDSTDNIMGIPKCGPKGAEKILGIEHESESESAGEITFYSSEAHNVKQQSVVEYPYRSLQAYIDHYGELDGIKYFSENYQLVKLVETISVVLGQGYQLDATTL